MSEQKPATSSQQPELLSPVPTECFENGLLRDGIPERLERLQQAPHPRLANLLGLRKINDQFYLAWQPIPGKSLADPLPEDDLYRALRQMIDALEGLHQLGLVHGNLQPKNIIIIPDGVFLTDASPLLWTDEQKDIDAAVQITRDLLRPAGAELPEQHTRSLRSLAAFLDGGYLPDLSGPASPSRLQIRTLSLAIALLIAALAIAGIVAWYFHHNTPRMLQS
ncbi:MAG TPA: hypothetical protein VGG19_04015 [Tepidisphaeraceae bacterium]